MLIEPYTTRALIGAGGSEVDMAEGFMSEAFATATGAQHSAPVPIAGVERERKPGKAAKGKKAQKNSVQAAAKLAAQEQALAKSMSGGETEETRSAGDSQEASPAGDSRPGNGCRRIVLSVEPVMHIVTEGAIESLRRITSKAALVSPDWETAVKISNMCSAARATEGAGAAGGSNSMCAPILRGGSVGGGALDVSGCLLHPHLMGTYNVRRGDEYCSGRPVYTMTRGPAGGVQSTYYIYHKTTPGCASRWFIGPREGAPFACVTSVTSTKVQILTLAYAARLGCRVSVRRIRGRVA
jgi:hypothetical protein